MKFISLNEIPESKGGKSDRGSKYTAEFEAVVRMSPDEACEVTHEKIPSKRLAQQYYQALRKSSFAERIRLISRGDRIFLVKK